MPTIVGILSFMNRINFMLSWVEHEKSFITLRPDLDPKLFDTLMVFQNSFFLIIKEQHKNMQNY